MKKPLSLLIAAVIAATLIAFPVAGHADVIKFVVIGFGPATAVVHGETVSFHFNVYSEPSGSIPFDEFRFQLRHGSTLVLDYHYVRPEDDPDGPTIIGFSSLGYNFIVSNAKAADQQITIYGAAYNNNVFLGEATQQFQLNITHFWDAGAYVAPTCETAGKTVYTCWVCGDTKEEPTSEPALGHLWGPWQHDSGDTELTSMHIRVCQRDASHTEMENCSFDFDSTAATCTQPGMVNKVCQVCGFIIPWSYIPAFGHDWGAWAHDPLTTGASATHTQVCANDASHTETEGCTFYSVITPPSCLAGGYTTHTCSTCGYSYTTDNTPATGHDWGAWAHDPLTAGVSATHSRTCANDAIHIETEGCTFGSVITPPTCTEDGFTTHTCSVCGYSHTDSLIPAFHTPGGWVTLRQPTGYREGERVIQCLVCGAVLEREAIPKLDGRRYNNTACSLGTRFRDADPALTDKWYMATPLDLRTDGSWEVPLIAANRHQIGTVSVSLTGGMLQASYEITAEGVLVKEEFLTFFRGYDDITTVQPEEMPERGLPFGAAIPAADILEASPDALMFIRLVIDYDIFAKGIQAWALDVP